MSNQASIEKPSKLTRSRDRLEQAVARLESACGEAGARPSGAVQNTEMDALKEMVKQLRQENAALKRVNNQVSTRLDSAIERLRTAIGE